MSSRRCVGAEGSKDGWWGDLLPAMRRWLTLPGSFGVLGFILLYKLGDVSMGPMVRPL